MEELIDRVIERGIKRPVRMLIENRSFAAALVLIYSAIDMMAFLSLPEGRQDVMRSDFMRWAEAYLIGELPDGIFAKDLYGARCGVLRGTESRMAREGGCRRIRYEEVAGAEIVLPVETLADAFFLAVDHFVRQATDAGLRTVRLRLEQMQKVLPFE